MPKHLPPKPQRSHTEKDDDTEPGFLPVDPDQGPVPPVIPADPEHDRVVDPEV